MVELLLKNGADVNLQTKCGKSPLQRAVLAGNKGLFQLLLKNGANGKKASLKHAVHTQGTKLKVALKILAKVTIARWQM